MNKQKLTFEQWRDRYCRPITQDMKDELKQFHGIDAVSVIEEAQRRDYEFYLNGEFE